MKLMHKFSNQDIRTTGKVHEVKAFTSSEKETLGNPAGVVVSQQPLSRELMADIAKHAGLPITSFLVPKSGRSDHFDLRYYDLGGRECHICGHATIAATKYLLGLAPADGSKTFTFDLNPDQFNGHRHSIRTHTTDNKAIAIDLPPSELEIRDDEELRNKVADALGIQNDDILTIAFATEIRDFVVGIRDRDTLVNMKPDFAALLKLAESGPYQHEGLMVSAMSDGTDGFDLNARVFLPITGVNEDIACGSGNCSIIPYWYQRGFRPDDSIYTSVFPYPEGPEGVVGGVQTISYDPDGGLIQILSEAEYVDARKVPAHFFKAKDPLGQALGSSLSGARIA